MPDPFDPAFPDLPEEIPIFPLAGALLLPEGLLPLNIFEPRYLDMTAAALAAPQRLIGMIQPQESAASAHPPVFRTGCAGRIVSFAETADGRYLITLKGLLRFRIAEEMPMLGGYRRVRADFAPFRSDLEAPQTAPAIDRARLLRVLRAYLTHHGIEAKWEAIEGSDDARLVTSLAMMCPFQPSEKQAMLEAPTLETRAEIMTTLLEMALRERGGDEGRVKQ